MVRMVKQKDPKLASSHGHTKITTTICRKTIDEKDQNLSSEKTLSIHTTTQVGWSCRLVQSSPSPRCVTHRREGDYNAGSKPHAAPQPWGLAPGRQVQFTSRSHREPGEAETSPEKTHTLWDPGQKQLIATEPGADRPTYCSCRVPKEAGGILGTDPGASISGSLFYPGCAGEHQFGILPLAQQPAGTSLTRHLTGHPLI